MFLLLFIISILIALYGFYKWNYEYWKRRGVPGPTPTLFFGNTKESFFFEKSLGQIFNEIYDEYPHLPFVGIYRATSPSLLIRDPEFVREMTVKSFQNFHDNGHYVDKNVDPLTGRHPFFQRGEEWKHTRHILTPCFTSSKMKSVYPFIEENSRELVEFIAREPDASNGNGVEAKGLSVKFTLNNVAACAFGLEGNCFKEPDNEFRDVAYKFLMPETFTSYMFFLMSLVPSLQDYVSLRMIRKDLEDQLKQLVSSTLKYRKEKNISRNDFLHLMNQIKEESNGSFTEIDVAAQASTFFADGYETSSVTMSYVLYQLAANPEIQSILRQKIDQHFKENNGTLLYETLQEMVYLDAVINETLRMYPLTFLQKMCTRPYTYVSKKGDGLAKPSLVIEKGTTIILPVHALHHDPKYYEEPDSFKPERFLGENKEKLTKFAFLPFGEGPRSCLGKRFGLMQVKAGVAYIIKNYKLSVNKKTQTPLKYNLVHFMPSAIGGLWLDFEKID